MVNTISHLIAEQLIEPHDDGWQLAAPLETIRVGVPDSIRQLIETLVERLNQPDQDVLQTSDVFQHN